MAGPFPLALNSLSAQPLGGLNEALNRLEQRPLSADVILSVYNPTAGSGARADATCRLTLRLRQLGYHVEEIDDLATLESAAGRWLQAGRLRAVVAAGGDGTVAELWNRLPPSIPVVPLAQGTENLLAKYLDLYSSGWALTSRLNRTVERVAQTIHQGLVLRLDAGRVTQLSLNDRSSGEGVPSTSRLFGLMCSCGFDAEVVRCAHASRAARARAGRAQISSQHPDEENLLPGPKMVTTGKFSRWSYAKPIWQSLRKYRYPAIRVSSLQRPTSRREQRLPAGRTGIEELVTDRLAPTTPSQTSVVRWVFALNLPCYATSLPLAPGADGTDGYLDLCAFPQGGVLPGLWYWLATLLRTPQRLHRWLTGCQRGLVCRLRLESDEPVPYQLDGDPGGWLPIELDVLPGRLGVMVPMAWAARRGLLPADAQTALAAAC